MKTFKEVLNENEIHPLIQSLIDDMIERKVQRKTMRVVKDSSGYKRFMNDVKPAIDAKMLIIKHNPVDDNELWVSLGPESLKKI